MPIINQNSFINGELSPKLQSRVDTGEYKKAVKTAVNSVILPHGPISKRSGFQFIAEQKTSSEDARLVRYQFSQDTAYILEFGNQYIRFFTSSGQVVESDINISGITKANPGVVTTSSSHGLSNGDHVYITGVSGMTEVNSSTIPYKVANVTSTTFELNDVDGNNVNTTSYTTYSSGGVVNRIYEITSPYTASQVDTIQYVQSGSSLYIAHPDVSPRVLVRNSNTDWSISEIEFLPPPTYESGYENTGVTVTPAATTGTGVNFTASSGLWLEADIGRQIINNSSGETGRASIVSITSSTVAVCDIIEDFTDTNAIASADWKIDLSPVCSLEVDKTQAGAIANIRSEYTSGSLGDRFSITGITAANPGVVTTSSAHGFSAGDRVQIKDVSGMTQVNGNVYTVGTTTSTTFQLKDDNNNNVDTSGYTAYSSGGIVRKELDNLSIDAFRSADVGKYILMNGGVLQIIAVNSATDIDAEILKSLNSSDTTSNWSLEESTWDSTRGYPRAVGLHQSRLWYGGTTAQPQTVWASEIDIFEGFGAGPDDEDAIDIELSSNEVNQINWISASRDLVLGTSGGEITLGSGSSAAITPSSIQQSPRTYHGSKTQQVVNVRDEILFLQGSSRKIRTFRYDFNIDGYTGEDLTFLAEHITEGGLVELVYVQEPDTNICAVTTNGDLLVGTYDRSKQIIAWTKSTTDGDFKRINTITSGEVDQVWIIVERTINSNTKRYIELWDSLGDTPDDLDSFSDSYLTISENYAITNITTANPGVVTTSSAHGLSNGDTVIIKDLVDPYTADLDSSKTNMSTLNNGIYTVANVTSTTFELTDSGGSNINTTNYNSYGSSGNVWKRVTTLSGLDHLEGKSVAIRADGAVQPAKTVSSGSITLDTPAGEVVVGLPYTWTCELVGLEFEGPQGSHQGQRTR